jgi:hypothetical protein
LIGLLLVAVHINPHSLASAPSNGTRRGLTLVMIPLGCIFIPGSSKLRVEMHRRVTTFGWVIMESLPGLITAAILGVIIAAIIANVMGYFVSGAG